MFEYKEHSHKVTMNPDTRRVYVELSKLLVERWLETERGLRFAKDVDDVNLDPDPRERMRKALEKQHIYIADCVTPEPNTDSYHGSIACDESKPSLAFIWKIPYQVRPPESAVSAEVLTKWIESCDDWIKQEKHNDPKADFPPSPSVYIPLATT